MGKWSLDELLRHDRRISVAGLVILCGLAWLYLLSGAGMSSGNFIRLVLHPHQPGADGMEAMSESTGARMWLISVTMWWVMMIAMMIPSAAPTILLYARVYRHAAATTRTSALPQVSVFAAGYLLLWLLFSLSATWFGHFLEMRGQLPSPTGGPASRWFSAAIFVTAGFYQFSQLKNLCLTHCRSPAAFLSRNWRPGTSGALWLGAMHGAYCVGCCWVLMTLLFVGGLMNLLWIVALTALVLTEKLVPKGELTGKVIGLLLIVRGVTILSV